MNPQQTTQKFNGLGKNQKAAWLITMLSMDKPQEPIKLVVVATNLRDICNHYPDVIEATPLGAGEYLINESEVTVAPIIIPAPNKKGTTARY